VDSIRRFHTPQLRRPYALLAFEGWNDASDSASGVITYLIEQLETGEAYAAIDPEEFYDFQAHRPNVGIDETGQRSLTWPATRFYAAHLPEQPHDLILVVGEEPSHRWRTYGRTVTRLLADSGVEKAVLLGGFIGQVAHTLPVPIFGVGSPGMDIEGLGLMSSGYEGPTGIVSVIHEAFKEEGTPASMLWAANPHYLAANPNPKSMLALLTKVSLVLGMDLPITELEGITRDYLDRVENAIESSSDLGEYIADLEENEDEPIQLDPSMSGELVDEIETFLRDQQ
jgi:hypothetical protein